MNLQKTLAELVQRRDLSRHESHEVMLSIMRGEASPELIAGMLVALRMKSETVDEISGFASAMRQMADSVDLGAGPLVDTCGTGGDGAGTFNVSTAAALVAAGAGARVAKHGNRSASGACGSADVLEALGVGLLSDPGRLRRCLEQAGVAFLFAPAQHPAMRHAVGPRRQLGLRTVFNVLGPLCNPAGARRQVLGVFDPALTEPMARVLGELGSEHALVVHGAGGLDEISTLGPSQIAEWDGERVRTWVLEPLDLGIPQASIDDLRGGDASLNAALVRTVLGGTRGPARDIVELNAAAAVWVSGRAASLQEGLELARQAIDRGAAEAALLSLVAMTAQEGA